MSSSRKTSARIKLNPAKSLITLPMADIGWCLSIILATLWVYAGVVHFQFIHFDDPVYITENHHLFSGITSRSIHWAFTTTLGDNWHPLTWMSHLLDDQVYGLDPGGHHLTNLLWHLANTLLLYIFIRKVSDKTCVAVLVAGLFALHPQHVESVAWVSERKDVLSTFFWLSTLLAYVFYRKHPNGYRYICVLAGLILSLLCKPMAVTLPIILLLLDYWPLGRFQTPQNYAPIDFIRMNRKLFFEKIPLIITVVLFMMVIFGIENIQSLENFPLSYRAANAVISHGIYIYKLFIPINLSIFYPYPRHFQLWQILAAGLFLLASLLGAIRYRKQYPYVFVGYFWFIISILPVIGLVQIGRQAMADRYTYLPHIGLFIAVALLLNRLFEKYRHGNSIIVAISILWLGLNAGMAKNQCASWKNSTTLFTHAINATTDNYLAHNNLGLVLYAENKVREAAYHYKRALEIKPDYPEALNNLGVIAVKNGENEKARTLFKRALRIDPRHFKASNNLAALNLKTGNTTEAIEAYRALLRRKPDYAQAHGNLAAAFFMQKDLKSAENHYAKAIALAPFDAKLRTNFGILLRSENDLKDAVIQLRKATQLAPDYAFSHLYLGDVLLSMGRAHEAIGSLRKSLQLNPRDPQAHFRIGDALRQTGDLDAAMEHYKAGFLLKPAFSPRFEILIKAYERKGHYHQIAELYQKMMGSNPELHFKICLEVARMYARHDLDGDAEQWLESAITKGSPDWQQIRQDPSLWAIAQKHLKADLPRQKK